MRSGIRLVLRFGIHHLNFEIAKGVDEGKFKFVNAEIFSCMYLATRHSCGSLWEIYVPLSVILMTLLRTSVSGLLGCGSGLSGETLTENGHHWIGLDISESMLSRLQLTCIISFY